MRYGFLLLTILPGLAGCRTHQCLCQNTVKTTTTLTELNYKQVLNNIAMFVHNPASMPSVAVINSGTVTVDDTKGLSGNATYAPTMTFSQQVGGFPILSLFAGPSAERSLTENWSMVPVNDIDNLRRIRCAFQLLVLGGETSDCFHCRQILQDFYLGEINDFECIIPPGFFQVGCKRDVPRHACFVGNYCDTYVWVMPEGVEGLTRFTMTVIDLATGKPHAPTRKVVRTYKKGTLETTEITTNEIDKEQLEKWRKEEQCDFERPRLYVDPPKVNPGLFFVR
ncbi:MAG: hypothetical protein AB7K24_20075 [Gemmataceae bacterium]